MNFIQQARELIHDDMLDKAFVIDIIEENSFKTILLTPLSSTSPNNSPRKSKACSNVPHQSKQYSERKLWSTPLKRKFPTQLLTIYRMMYTKDFNEISLGSRVYLKDSNQHFLYRGTMRKDRSEDEMNFHLERGDDKKCSWVKRTKLDFWCKPVYSHCWYNDQNKVELYHIFGKEVYEFAIQDEKQSVVVGSFYYNIGEFVMIEKEKISISPFDDNVRCVVANIKKEVNEIKKEKKALKVTTVLAKSPTVEEPSPVFLEKPAAQLTELIIASRLAEGAVNFKSIIPLLVSGDVLRKFITKLILLDDTNVETLLQQHHSKATNSNSNRDVIAAVSKAILSNNVDMMNIFYILLDGEHFDICSNIIASAGKLNGFEASYVLELHKMKLQHSYQEISERFTNCMRQILACEEKIEDDENARVKRFGSLFSLSTEITSRIIEDRNVCTHSQVKFQRLKGALEDRRQCLREVNIQVSKRKSSKKHQLILTILKKGLAQLEELSL